MGGAGGKSRSWGGGREAAGDRSLYSKPLHHHFYPSRLTRSVLQFYLRAFKFHCLHYQ
jgi:hypothetical protein